MSPEPAVSVVIGAGARTPTLASCLTALEPQRHGVEVLVVEAEPAPAELRERFPWAQFLVRPGAIVPELWREGIDASRGPIVALTIACMEPAPDWIHTIRVQHERHDAVAGAIDPADRLRLRDWAEYFCRYAPDMLPFDGRPNAAIPGDNASYKRDLLERTRELYRDGFWEPVVNGALERDGVVLWHAPELVVRQGRSAGLPAFVRQRLRHGAGHGSQRGAHFGVLRNLAGVAGAPLVPVLISLRILQHVRRRRRLRWRVLCAMPLILLFNAAWALGEARGHLTALRAR